MLSLETLPEVKPHRLKDGQRAFVAHYLTCWNGAEAARRAGFTKNPDVAAQRLMANTRIRSVINARLKELEASSVESVIDLARMSRGSMQYFIDPDNPELLDLKSQQARTNLDLIKAITIDNETRYDKDGNPITRNKVRLEVADKLAARTVLAKAQGLLREQDENSKVVNQNLTINNLQVIADESGLSLRDLIGQLQTVIAEQSKVIEIDSSVSPAVDVSPAVSMLVSDSEQSKVIDVEPTPSLVAPDDTVITQRVISDEDEEIIGTS